MQDIYGNYQADLTLAPPINPGGLPSSGSGGAGLYGSGSPEGVKTAIQGTTYIDVDTDNFWVKESGTGNTGWVLIVGP